MSRHWQERMEARADLSATVVGEKYESVVQAILELCRTVDDLAVSLEVCLNRIESTIAEMKGRS